MSHGYQETLDYLYSALPMFQRVGAAAFKKDLSNTIALCNYLGNPQHKFKSVHVGGTNGKGSSSHMIASVLQEAGYKTGLYTSPHLKDFTERIKVNGQSAEQDYVIDFVKRIKPQIELLRPSFFEITVVMAFDYFVRQNVDIAVIEVGMGGRLDSTNVIVPILSLITNIGSDHKEFLGDNPQKIAIEKAGIIKSKVPIAISEYQEDVAQVFEEKSREHNAMLYFASKEFTCSKNEYPKSSYEVINQEHLLYTQLELDLLGNYQQKNLPGVLKCLDLLKQNDFSISDEQIIQGLKKVITNTGLKGRWQVIAQKPLTVCDTGHNLEGIKEVLEQIDQQKFDQLHMVWGSVKDKDIDGIFSILPENAKYYFCEAKIPRALPADALKAKAEIFGLKGEVIQDVNEALRAARKHANLNDMIFIGGSTFVVAELTEL